jgi:hypothetical protein
MPRIECTPKGWDESLERQYGDGTPTYDVCAECVTQLVVGEYLTGMGDVASLDVEHPPYADDAYECIFCDKRLGDADE